jgi:hypothetical protein
MAGLVAGVMVRQVLLEQVVQLLHQVKVMLAVVVLGLS